MREALHIFTKDSRQFRYPIGLLFLWLTLFTGVSASPPALNELGTIGDQVDYVVTRLAPYVFSAMWWFLISLAFHAEALPGDRQFWLTRPYSRAGLAGAKAMFVAAYVSLPLMVAQIVIAAARDLPLMDLLISVAWTQVLILIVIILPAAALAAMTATLTQFIATGMVAPLLFVVSGLFVSWFEFEWVRSTVAVLAIGMVSIAVLTVQFTRRRTKTSRLIAVAGLLGMILAVRLLPWLTAFALQASLTAATDHSVSAEYVASDPKSMAIDRNGLHLLFRVHHPASIEVACEAADITIVADSGRTWSPPLAMVRRQMWARGDQCGVYVMPPQDIRNAVESHAASVRARLYVTVFGEAQSTVVPVRTSATVVPRVGVCSAARPERPPLANLESEFYTRVACTTPFRTPRVRISLAVPGEPLRPEGVGARSYSPFPSDLTFQPVTLGAWTLPEGDSVTVTTQKPIAHVTTVVETRELWRQ